MDTRTKIELIREHRALTGSSLRDAKDAVEAGWTPESHRELSEVEDLKQQVLHLNMQLDIEQRARDIWAEEAKAILRDRHVARSRDLAWAAFWISMAAICVVGISVG